MLDIQQGGSSQSEMLERFDTVLRRKIGIGVQDCTSSSSNFIYLDDAIFTGNRLRRDLEPWIKNDAPQKATVYVIVNGLHTGGDYYSQKQLQMAARDAGKAIAIHTLSVRSIENRRSYKNQSEVLWPSEFPEGGSDEISAYTTMLKDAGYPPEKRVQGSTPKNGVFSGEVGRAALERVFLKAGVGVPGLKCASGEERHWTRRAYGTR